jgi:hypothetical protein
MKSLELDGVKRECRRSQGQAERCSIEPLNPAQPPRAWSVIQKTGAFELVRVELALFAQRQGAGLGWIQLRPLNAGARE